MYYPTVHQPPSGHAYNVQLSTYSSTVAHTSWRHVYSSSSRIRTAVWCLLHESVATTPSFLQLSRLSGSLRNAWIRATRLRTYVPVAIDMENHANFHPPVVSNRYLHIRTTLWPCRYHAHLYHMWLQLCSTPVLLPPWVPQTHHP